MNRNFALLGLREDADREAIKAAYERRRAKYKSADYSDDPDYVNRKLAELKIAYENALAAAKDGAGKTEPEKESSGRTYSQWETETISRKQDDKQYRREKEKNHKSNASDMQKAGRFERVSTLKEKAEEMGAKAAAKAKEADKIINAASQDNAFSENNPHKEQKKEVSFGRPYGNLPGNKKFLPLGIMAAVLVFSLFLNFISGFDSDDTYFDDSYTDYAENYSDEDYAVHEMAEEILNTAMGTELEYAAGWSYKECIGAEIKKYADRFVKLYTSYDTLAELCDHLYMDTDDFYVSDIGNAEEQAAEVLNFYGFPPFELLQGYTDPYSGQPIDSWKAYFKYLNGYYREHFKEGQEGSPA